MAALCSANFSTCPLNAMAHPPGNSCYFKNPTSWNTSPMTLLYANRLRRALALTAIVRSLCPEFSRCPLVARGSFPGCLMGYSVRTDMEALHQSEPCFGTVAGLKRIPVLHITKSVGTTTPGFVFALACFGVRHLTFLDCFTFGELSSFFPHTPSCPGPRPSFFSNKRNGIVLWLTFPYSRLRVANFCHPGMEVGHYSFSCSSNLGGAWVDFRAY